jgi:PIN domain
VRIVLDTTELVADFYMSGTAFRVLADSLERLSATLVLPAVVIDEAVAKYDQNVRQLRSEAERFSSKFERLFEQRLTMPLEYIDKIASFYRSTLQSRIWNFPAEVAPYPVTPHADLVGRAARRKRPFNESGSGYRDALIWDTVLEMLRHDDEPIWFVSRNSRDFGVPPHLHDELLTDVTALGRSKDCIRLFGSIEELNKDRIFPALTKLNDLIASFADRTTVAGNALYQWLVDELDIELAMLLDTPISPLPAGHATVGSPRIQNIHRVSIDDVRLLPTGEELLVSCTADFRANVSVDVTWEQFQEYADVRDFLGEMDDEPFRVLSTDDDVWATVELSLTMGSESYAVSSCEVDRLKTDVMDVEFNPHPGG